ncbi:hypothetical protein AB0O28_38985 [Microbispora sp. NPDC088329]|uniref:hypothetical protein n=1 Tax=Microbispora sp. NPDC088329 TaxID=3154869 RepID=UPI00341CB80E
MAEKVTELRAGTGVWMTARSRATNTRIRAGQEGRNGVRKDRKADRGNNGQKNYSTRSGATTPRQPAL